MSESKIGAFADKDKQNLLAKKTLEHLQVISIAEIILKEKFGGDTDSWVLALFESLMLKNSAYLLEEKSVNVDNDVYASLNSKLGDTFWESDNYDHVISTGYQLISLFNKFMLGLNRNASSFHLADSLPDLRQIEKNIRSYAMKQNNLKSESAEKPSIANEPTVNINLKEKESTIFNDPARQPNTSNICNECNTKITIFNNDIEFSVDLHSQETVHKKAVAKTTKSVGDQPAKSFEKHHSETDLFLPEDELSVRTTLNHKIKNHSVFMNILSKREFYCSLCKCDISSIQNVESHVEGMKHTKAFEVHNMKQPADDVFKVDHSYIPVAELLD